MTKSSNGNNSKASRALRAAQAGDKVTQRATQAPSGGGDDITARPLYAQVRERLIERIQSGAWRPGQLIPNEFSIADELGVSQGTARKALAALAEEKLLVRHQGRGTFVVEHTAANVLFRFFNIHDADGRQVEPESADVVPVGGTATAQETKALLLGAGAKVVRIERIRLRAGAPFLAEKLVLPAAIFPGLAKRPALPNTLYDYFQREFGVLVARADEQLTVIAADADLAQTLAVAVGQPLLRIARIAYDPTGRRVEWRVSCAHLDGTHYLARNIL